MKLKIFSVVVIVMAAFAACKPTYKATDRPTSRTDNTTSTTDSVSSSTNKITPAADSTRMPTAPDPAKLPAAPDSTKMPATPDPAKMPAAPDSTKMPIAPDPAKLPAAPDSTKMPVVSDPAKLPAAPDSTKMPIASDPAKLPVAPDSTKMPITSDAAKQPVAHDSTKMQSTKKTLPTAVSVPEGTQSAFTTQYPAATNVEWTNYESLEAAPTDWKMPGWTTMDAKNHVVRFDLKNENYYAWYDSEGKWVGSSYTMKDPTKLPATLKTTIKTKYPGYSITSVNRKLQKDKKGYEVELDKEDGSKLKLLVNAEGRILKVIKVVKEKTE